MPSLTAALRLPAALLLSRWAVVDAQQDEVFELDFSPRSGVGAPPADLLRLMGLGDAADQGQAMAVGAGGGGGKRSRDSRESEMDQAFEGMISSMLGGDPSMRGSARSTGKLPDAAVVTSSGAGRPGVSEMMIEAPGLSGGRVPMSVLQGLFPGPVMFEGDEGDGASEVFGGPDPLVMDMAQDVGLAFQDDLMKMLHQSRSNAPQACQTDLRKNCVTARSQLHCLGQHAADVTPACRKAVEKSVPFVCSEAIDKFCDILRTGILTCLQGRLKELSGGCQDSVLATQAALGRGPTSMGAVTTAAPAAALGAAVPAGKAVVVAPAAQQGRTEAAQREAHLDAGLKAAAGSPANGDTRLALLSPSAPPLTAAPVDEGGSSQSVVALLLLVAIVAAVYISQGPSESWKSTVARFVPGMDDTGRRPLRGCELRQPEDATL